MRPSVANQAGVRAKNAVLAVLPRTAKVTRSPSDDASGLVVGGRKLRIKWIGEGRLREVREVLAARGSGPDVVVARRLSQRARDVLGEAGVGWVDESGAAEIAIGSIVVSRSGTPDRRPTASTRWTPSAVAIAEAALCGTRATASAMQGATGLSLGSCVNALRVLTDLELLEASAARGPGSARRVVNRDHLLDAYASAAAGLASELRLEVGVTWRDALDGARSVGASWDVAGLDYAVTGAVAAEVLAPHSTAVPTAEIYVNATTVLGLEAAATQIGLRPIPGGRLTLRPFPTTATSRRVQRIEGLCIAPWPRVYVDLLHAGVRGEDAAEHLRDVMHGR
jgi:hypothetical protein